MTPMPPQDPPALPGPEPAGPDATLQAVAAVSLRLLAGAVPKRTMDQLQRTLQQSPAEYPWQTVTQTVLAEPVDNERLVQQGLQAQRDWIVRGGREKPGPSLGRRTKGFFARLIAQLVFGVIFTLVVISALLLLKYKMPEFDIYRALTWIQDLLARR